jgi:hypothetical protein
MSWKLTDALLIGQLLQKLKWFLKFLFSARLPHSVCLALHGKNQNGLDNLDFGFSFCYLIAILFTCGRMPWSKNPN